MANCPKCDLDFSSFPSWFKSEPGFRFRDNEGDRCIVIGESEGMPFLRVAHVRVEEEIS